MKNKNDIHTFVILAYKESQYLEECIKSVVNQSLKSNVIIATTTDNTYIRKMANKYNLNIIVGNHTTIGGDFEFARLSAKTKLVTIAHQDDIYEPNYAENIINNYNKYPTATIIFSDYYEIRKGKKVNSNINLIIKRILLFSLKSKKLSKYTFFKRNALRFGSSICCPSVTFVNDNCIEKIFSRQMKCNVDWYAWEKLSKLNGEFIYISKKLIGHRIDETTTTTDIIKSGIRTKEDLEMFKKFWPNWISNIINKFYKNAEKSNKI